jgi:hypothetical protein
MIQKCFPWHNGDIEFFINLQISGAFVLGNNKRLLALSNLVKAGLFVIFFDT